MRCVRCPTVDLAKEVGRRYAQQVEHGGTSRPVHTIEPAVSVLVVTYQHAPFIRECLDGILGQQTDFAFEVVVGEDASEDGTREICVEYAQSHPDRIRLFLRDRALTQLPLDPAGVMAVKRLNGRFTRMAARGPVLALCEGDDRWTDPTKLQRQFDVLCRRPDIATVCHRATVEWTTAGGDQWQYTSPPRAVLSFEDIVWDRGTPTCTIMMRNVPLDDREFLEHSCRTLSVDYLVRAATSRFGDTYFIDRDMAVHRKHPGGISQSAHYADHLRLAESTRNLYLGIRALGPPDARSIVDPKLCGVSAKLAAVELRGHRFGRAARHALGAVGYALRSPRQIVRQRRRLWRPVVDALSSVRRRLHP